MNRLTIIGVAALCALALASFGTAGASAAETTGFTCIEGASGGSGTRFSDPDCSEPSATGNFGHLEIPVGKTTTGRVKKLTNPVLKTIIAGAAVTLEATGYECIECTGTNSGSAGAMKVSGTGGKLKITGVTVTSSPTKCFVESALGKGVVQTEPLTSETTGTNEAVVKPVTGTTLATFSIVAQMGQTCAVAGPVTVKGDANGTSKGAIGTTNIPASSKTLTIGVNGVGLTGEATGEAGEGGTFHPVALT